MTIFEQDYRGNLWRLEIAEHNGRRFLNWRKWYRPDGGGWKPTREGVTMPLGRMADLLASLEAAMASLAPDGLTDSPTGPN